MCIAEIMYLKERRRIQISVDDIQNYLVSHSNIYEYPLDYNVIMVASTITDIPELHDRLIAATAVCTNGILITNDPIITQSSVIKTFWQ